MKPMLEPSCGSPDYSPGSMPAEKTAKIMLLKPGHGGSGPVMPDPGDGKIWKTCNPRPATGDLATGDLPYHAVHYVPPQPVPVQEARQGRQVGDRVQLRIDEVHVHEQHDEHVQQARQPSSSWCTAVRWLETPRRPWWPQFCHAHGALQAIA